MNSSLYTSPVDAMNNSRIKILVSSTYEPHVSPYYSKFDDVKPITSFMELEEECISMVSVSELVFMLSEKVPFSLYNREDVLLIHSIITNYISTFINTNNTLTTEDIEDKVFLDNCKSSLEQLGSSYKLELERNRTHQLLQPGYNPSLEDILTEEINKRTML